MNKVLLLGNAGKAPEIRVTVSGKKVANLVLATSQNYKNGDKWEEETTWHNIVAWEYLAEKLEKYAIKGTEILVEGRLVQRNWTNNEGEVRYITEIIANNIILLRRQNKEDKEEFNQERREINVKASDDLDDNWDDLPF